MAKNLIINITLSILSGVLLILSTAGFGIPYLVFIAFVPILFAVERGGLHPLISGWIMGFLYWVVCLSWMTITFSYFGGAPLIASIGLLLFISISGGFFFFAPFTYVARKYKDPFILGLVFIALEALKGTVFFAGVPWLNLAQSQYENTWILGFVRWFGEYGLSLIIMVINVLIFKTISQKRPRLNGSLLAVAVVVMLTPGFISTLSPLKYDKTINVKVIQPGYKQEDKWQRDKLLAIINDLNKRILAVDTDKYDLIILPESTYPANFLETPFIMDVLQQVGEKVPVIAGTDRKIRDNKGEIQDLYNSMVLISKNNNVQIYDKIHLTPFGEYFPFENLLKPIKEFFFGQGKMFSFGSKSVMLVAGDIKIAPSICFESGFSELLKTPIAMGANFIAIISNDSWFGENQGRIQHLAVNAVRAAEYGRSTAVATQDGISALIMPTGEVVKVMKEQTPAELDYEMPLVNERTIYSYIRYGWIVFIVMWAYIIIKRNRKK